MTLYMHTLDGMPASYYERDGVCFTTKQIRLAKSVRQIRREQKVCKERRAAEGNIDNFRYGYATVVV